MKNLKIPVGISDFSEIRENGYYYIDKSGLIAELLRNEATKVTLITRPRRFGKTLAMSMLADFFDIRRESRGYFSGLEIEQHKGLCKDWMNQYPVLFSILGMTSVVLFGIGHKYILGAMNCLCESLLACDSKNEGSPLTVRLKSGHPLSSISGTAPWNQYCI